MSYILGVSLAIKEPELWIMHKYDHLSAISMGRDPMLTHATLTCCSVTEQTANTRPNFLSENAKGVTY